MAELKPCPICGALLMQSDMNMAMKRLKTLTVSRAVYEQTAWERDIAMEQLAAHGIGFGEECEAKGTNCTPAVVRCRDCIYYHPKTGWCDELSFFQTSDGVPCSPYESADWKMFMEDDFCSRGKRAEDNHESV